MKESRFHLVLVSIIAGVLILSIACSPRAMPAPIPTPVAAPARLAWELEWENLIKAARKEARLSVFGSDIGPDVRNALSQDFKDKFGIAMELVSGLPRQQSEKILRERRAGIFLFDVFLGGAQMGSADLKPAGVLEFLDGVLFLPEIVDQSKWLGFEGVYFEKTGVVAGGFGTVTTPVWFNTDLVRAGEITSFKDLLNPKWKGKIVIYDPTIHGPGAGHIQEMWTALGEDFLNKLVDQGPTTVRDLRQLGEWLAKGKFAIAIGGAGSIMRGIRMAGGPIAPNDPPLGSMMTPGNGATGLISQAPHPNAGKLFVNWILTREAQTVFARAAGAASRRVDIANEHMLPVERPMPGVTYIPTDEELLKARAELLPTFKRIFQPVM